MYCYGVFRRPGFTLILREIERVTVRDAPGPEFSGPVRKLIPEVVIKSRDGNLIVRPEGNLRMYKAELIRFGKDLRQRGREHRGIR